MFRFSCQTCYALRCNAIVLIFEHTNGLFLWIYRTDPLDLNAGWLSGLVDINTEKDSVQERIADYMTGTPFMS